VTPAAGARWSGRRLLRSYSPTVSARALPDRARPTTYDVTRLTGGRELAELEHELQGIKAEVGSPRSS